MHELSLCTGASLLKEWSYSLAHFLTLHVINECIFKPKPQSCLSVNISSFYHRNICAGVASDLVPLEKQIKFPQASELNITWHHQQKSVPVAALSVSAWVVFKASMSLHVNQLPELARNPAVRLNTDGRVHRWFVGQSHQRVLIWNCLEKGTRI